MKNISVGDIKPNDEEDDVQVIKPPSSSNVPQDGDKDGRVENEDTHCRCFEQTPASKFILDTRFILVWAECPYVQSVAACVISTKKGS